MPNHDDINSINTCHHTRSLLAGSQSSPDYLYVTLTERDTFFPISFAQPRHALLPEDSFTFSVLPPPKISFTESHLGVQGRVLHRGPHLSPPCSSGHRGPPGLFSSSGSFLLSQEPWTQSQHRLCTPPCTHRWSTSKGL